MSAAAPAPVSAPPVPAYVPPAPAPVPAVEGVPPGFVPGNPAYVPPGPDGTVPPVQQPQPAGVAGPALRVEAQLGLHRNAERLAYAQKDRGIELVQRS